MINADTLNALLSKNGTVTFERHVLQIALDDRVLYAYHVGQSGWDCPALGATAGSMADAFNRLAHHMLHPDRPAEEPTYHVVRRAPGTIEIVCVPADSEQPSTVIRVASETPISTYPGWARAETFTSLEDAFEAFTKRTER